MSSASDGEFEGHLGLLDCVLLSVGGMVGSAIFVYPGSTGRLTGPSAILAWALAGVLMTAIALCYTELTLAFPRAGAPAVFPFETLGPSRRVRAFASYLEGVGYTFGWIFGITVSALAIAEYLAVVFPAASGHTVGIALVAVVLAGSVNLLGIEMTSHTNLVLSAVLLAVLVTFVAAGFANAAPTNYRPFFTGGPAAFLGAVQIATTAYGAWTVIPSAVAEIRAPARTVPRAILFSLGVATLLYTAVVAALHGVVPGSGFVPGTPTLRTPLGAATEALGVSWIRYLLPIGAVAAIFTTMLVGTLSAARVLFALGENGTLPPVFAAVSDRTGVPWVGVLVVTVAGGVLATFPAYFYELLVVSSIVGTGVPYAINLLSFVGLRYYRTDVTPAFRVPGGYAVAALASIALAVTMIGLGSTEVVWSVAALAIVAGYYAVRVVVPSPVIARNRNA